MPYKLLNKKKDKEILLFCKVAIFTSSVVESETEEQPAGEIELGRNLTIVEAVLNIKRSDIFALKTCDLEILDDDENYVPVKASIIEFWDGRREFVEMPLGELYDIIFVDKTDVN